jgi:hypothetical protein
MKYFNVDLVADQIKAGHFLAPWRNLQLPLPTRWLSANLAE